MAKTGKVETLGPIWERTAPFVEKGKQISDMEASNALMATPKKPKKMNKEQIKEVENQIDEIKTILKKAGISLKLYPFNAVKNKDGEIVDFVPKGKNPKQIKENIEKYREEMSKALEQGKITQEEFETLNDNLEDLMKEKEIELNKNEKGMEVTNDEIEENLEVLVIHNFGKEEHFEKLCEEYNNYDLEKRKFCLEKFNSKINTQLGIAGNLSFSKNPNLKFENSFSDKGYYLTEQEVEAKDLKQTLYTMMEKSLMRQKEIINQEKLSAEQKKAMHKKIMEERERKYKKQKESQDRKNKKIATQRMRNMWQG